MSNIKKGKKINWTRIIAIILAFLMLASMGTLGIMMLINPTSAADISYNESNYTFSSETDGDTYIAVGLMYGTGVTVSFEIKAPYGFVVGATTIGKNKRAFDALYRIDSNIAAVTVDANLYKKSMSYYLTDNPAEAVIGGYHIEFKNTEYKELPLSALVDDVNSLVNDSDLYAFPTIINGENRVRIGNFTTKAAAEEVLAKYAGNFNNYVISVVGPSNTCSTVVNPNTDMILFEYDSISNADSMIGLMPFQGDRFESYIQTPANNLYEGVMAFKPLHTATYTGVELINLLELESYVEGVLPYEISNSWSTEVLRTFAITVRSYALSSYCKWFGTYGFDLTCTTSDQVYRGRNRVNDAIVDAVNSTKDLVITYGGKICGAYYSSSVGGSTVSSEYVWGSARGYLVNVSTPWEHYADYNHGVWHSEVSPTDLCNTLRSKGYTELTGAIKSITSIMTDDGSGYEYSMTFTDTSGNQATVKRADSVRTVLSAYVNSANFIFGQGSLDFTYNKVLGVKVIGETASEPIKPDDSTFDFLVNGYVTNNQSLISDVNIITDGFGTVASEFPVAYVLTSTGRKVIMNSCVAVADELEESSILKYDNGKVRSLTEDPDAETETATKTDNTTGSIETTTSIGDNSYIVTSQFSTVTIETALEKVTETITAKDGENFIFAGKGWGHGVGISQYGAKDLSDAGAKAEDILAIYFSGISIVNRKSLK